MNNLLRNVSLGRKLTIAILVTSLAAVLLATASFVIFSRMSVRVSMESDLAALGEVLATNSTAAVSFNDRAVALELLSGLHVRPSVTLACIYRHERGAVQLLAAYQRPGENLHCAPQQSGSTGAVSDHLAKTTPIRLNNELIGEIYMQQSDAELRNQYRLHGMVLAAVFPACLLVALALATVFRGLIASPILALAATAKRISESRDYQIRAPRFGTDEVGSLIDGFNYMLAQIQGAQESLRANAEQIRIILQTVPDGIVTISALGRIESANPAAEFMFQQSESTLVGRSIDELIPGLRPLAGAGALVPLGEGKRREPLQGQRADGTSFPLDVAIGEMELNGRDMLTCAIRDVSESVTAERETRELNRKLKEKIAESQRANQELSAAIRQLRETQDQLVQTEKLASLGSLVAGVAHEINTPIGIGVTAASTLHGRTQDLARALEDDALTRNGLQKYVEIATQSAEMLLSNLDRAAELVRSFKQVAVDQSNSERRRFLLREYLDEILLSLRPQLKKTPHRVELDCDDDLEVDTYPGALSQVITNLVMNALTHAFPPDAEPGRISLRVGAEQGQIRLDFSDDGCGIDAAVLPKIFDPFFTTRRGLGGSGLGLHIVYNLVTQQLGGQISAASTPGHGTGFQILIPQQVSTHESVSYERGAA